MSMQILISILVIYSPVNSLFHESFGSMFTVAMYTRLICADFDTERYSHVATCAVRCTSDDSCLGFSYNGIECQFCHGVDGTTTDKSFVAYTRQNNDYETTTTYEAITTTIEGITF